MVLPQQPEVGRNKSETILSIASFSFSILELVSQSQSAVTISISGTLTVIVKDLVLRSADPFVIVAASVTVWFPCSRDGGFTVPSASTTSVLLDAQLMMLPYWPIRGRKKLSTGLSSSISISSVSQAASASTMASSIMLKSFLKYQLPISLVLPAFPNDPIKPAYTSFVTVLSERSKLLLKYVYSPEGPKYKL